MPTLNWIQEKSWDRYYEQGSNGSEVVERTYRCRVCGKSFNTIALRDECEVGHPVSNPTIFYRGVEICGERLDITVPVTVDCLLLRNVESLVVNGEVCNSQRDLVDKVSAENLAFLDVHYGNTNIDRRLKINVCIADPTELDLAENAFFQYLDIGGLNPRAVVSFTEKVGKLKTVQVYCDGLVRYLQGVMAKDIRSDAEPFELFLERFNQASLALKNYDTALSHALRSIIDFNRNDFAAMSGTGIPMLDSATEFFQGGERGKTDQYPKRRELPVDRATEVIVSHLLVNFRSYSLEDIELEITSFSPQYLSLQDKMKLSYICFRKCLHIGDMKAVQKYRKTLRFDDAFSEIIGDING